MSKIKLSVVIPVFNGLPHIKKAIDSVLKEDISDMEVIIVDNCSTDGTWEYLSTLNDSKLVVIRNEYNIGLKNNWNKSIKLAKGEYVKLLPADDYVLEGSLKKQIKILDEHKDVSLVSGAKVIVNEKGEKLFVKKFLNKDLKIDGHKGINMVVKNGTNALGEGGCVMFRLNDFNKTNGFNDEIPYLIDLQMWFDLLLHGKLYVMHEPVAAFRIWKKSLSVENSKTQLKEFNQFMVKCYRNKIYKIKYINLLIFKIKSFIYFYVKKFIYHYLKLTNNL